MSIKQLKRSRRLSNGAKVSKTSDHNLEILIGQLSALERNIESSLDLQSTFNTLSGVWRDIKKSKKNLSAAHKNLIGAKLSRTCAAF